MNVSLPLKKVVRSPSGKAVTNNSLAEKLVKYSRSKSHVFIPGGKLEIINARYINQFVTHNFWLNKYAKINAFQVVKDTLKIVENAKNNEFFIVIAQQAIQDNLGLRIPYQVFDKQWLERKNKSQLAGFVLSLYWLVIPIKNLLRKLKSEKPVLSVEAWRWIQLSPSVVANGLLSDFMLLTQTAVRNKVADDSNRFAQLSHLNGEQVVITTSNLTEYEYRREAALSVLYMTELQAESNQASLVKSIGLVLGSQGNKIVWIGVTDGIVKQTINLSSLYALTDGLPLELVPQAHQKFILDAIYALPFTPTVNIQLLIEVLTLQLVAQNYAVRLLK